VFDGKHPLSVVDYGRTKKAEPGEPEQKSCFPDTVTITTIKSFNLKHNGIGER
jgi:hypothetical protein